MLTHDGRRTTHDDGRQPIAIGHLSDSGDLKTMLNISMYCKRIVNDCRWKTKAGIKFSTRSLFKNNALAVV